MYADADFAELDLDRCSVSGVAVMFDDTAVGFGSGVQHCVTLLTPDAEYVALGEGVNQGPYVMVVLTFLQTQLNGITAYVCACLRATLELSLWRSFSEF